MGLGGQRPAPAALSLYALCRRLCGPQIRFERVRKISPIPGFDTRNAILTTLSRPTAAFKCDCLIYVLCLQKNPVHIRPCLGFKFVCLPLSLIVDIAYSIRILDYLGKCGITLVIMFVIKNGKDLVRIL
jgi:hypothetical protein